MERGYIKLWRRMLDWEWFDDSLTLWFFVRLLMLANWEDKKWHGLEVKRGTFISSVENLRFKQGYGKRLKRLTTMQVRTLIARLKSTNEITSESTTTYTVFSIVNYEKYQSNESIKITNEVTNEQQTNNKPTTTTKEVKNIRIKDSTPSTLEDVVDFMNNSTQAANFWDYYESNGWKVGKNSMKDWKSAARRWMRVNNNAGLQWVKP